METRANYAIIGMFTIAVIATAFGFVFWFAGTESGVDRPTYRVEFTGSVAGLSKGSPVLFNGIRVGDVVTVDLSDEAPDQAYATIQVGKTTPIRSDTRASLDVNLLSGVAQVALTGGQKDAPVLGKRDPKDAFPIIVADTGGLGSVVQTAKATAEKANLLLDLVTDVVKGNRGNIDASIANVKTFTDALASNSKQIEGAIASIGEAATKIGPLAAKLEVLTDNATAVIQAVEPDRLKAIVRNVESVTQTIEDGRQNLANLFRDGASLAGRLNDTAPKLDQVMTDLGRALTAVDPVKLNQTIDNAQRFSAGLAASTADVQATAKNASSLTAKLDIAATRIDGVLKAAEDFLGSAAGQEGKSTFASIRDAMDRFGKASDNLNRQATVIGQGVTRFSGVGAKQVEALGTDARRAVNSVGRAAQTLERNPSSVIFGTGRATIPEFRGQ